jgi:hypothetical protein
MADQAALFDLPSTGLPRAASPAPGPSTSRSRVRQGRARQTYARTVEAEVRVQRRTMLHTKALRSFDKTPKLVIGHVDPDDLDEPSDPGHLDEEGPYSRHGIATDWTAALGWLLDPTSDLWPLIDAGALRLLAVDVDLTEHTGQQCRLAWTVTVKLEDVAALRDIAVAAVPDGDTHARTEIGESLAVAWRWAAEPYAPLRAIPGITWTPVQVTVEHKPARPASTA